jgi:hypothetical protein
MDHITSSLSSLVSRHTAVRNVAAETRHFLSFLYVCPEPVLVK